MSEYRDETIAHINQVAVLLLDAAGELGVRATSHDRSKFSPEEREIFERVTPKLKTLIYGSDEYKESLAELGPALKHHYEANRHHPEHFEDGIVGMNLYDIVEMVCDWMAAVKRMKDGDIDKSLEINRKRFGIDDQLYAIIKNTVDALRPKADMEI
jgi:hypothetical protein